jgi:hypothetical protein
MPTERDKLINAHKRTEECERILRIAAANMPIGGEAPTPEYTAALQEYRRAFKEEMELMAMTTVAERRCAWS